MVQFLLELFRRSVDSVVCFTLEAAIGAAVKLYYIILTGVYITQSTPFIPIIYLNI